MSNSHKESCLPPYTPADLERLLLELFFDDISLVEAIVSNQEDPKALYLLYLLHQNILLSRADTEGYYTFYRLVGPEEKRFDPLLAKVKSESQLPSDHFLKN